MHDVIDEQLELTEKWSMSVSTGALGQRTRLTAADHSLQLSGTRAPRCQGQSEGRWCSTGDLPHWQAQNWCETFVLGRRAAVHGMGSAQVVWMPL